MTLLGIICKTNKKGSAVNEEEYETFFGGQPITLRSQIEDELIKCALCSKKMVFVLQISCPLNGCHFERQLYVFACTEKKCWNKAESWLVLREQCPDTEINADNKNNRNRNENSKNKFIFPKRVIVCEEEEDSDMIGIQQSVHDSQCIGTDSLEVSQYEKSTPEHGDLIFHKFLKRIQINPHQIIRYDWNKVPLRYTDKSVLKLEANKCSYCDSPRVFEFQILPTLNNYLFMGKRRGLEYGMVYVYTCMKSCSIGNSNFKKENVFVEPDMDFEAVESITHLP